MPETETSLTSFLTSSAGILRNKITGHDPESEAALDPTF